jgi:hypothetical protein
MEFRYCRNPEVLQESELGRVSPSPEPYRQGPEVQEGIAMEGVPKKDSLKGVANGDLAPVAAIALPCGSIARAALSCT